MLSLLRGLEGQVAKNNKKTLFRDLRNDANVVLCVSVKIKFIQVNLIINHKPFHQNERSVLFLFF